MYCLSLPGNMKSVIIYGIHAVGMHHHYKGQLPIQAQFKLQHEPSNPVDPNAVFLYRTVGIRAAYISRLQSPAIVQLMQRSRTFVCRPQDRLFWLSVDQGQCQECNVGFRINDDEINAVQSILRGFCYKIV